MKTKWTLGLAVILAMTAASAAYADGGSCGNQESRISELEKRVLELEAMVKAAPVPAVKIKACNDSKIDLRTVASGFKCRTSKGAIYERVARVNFGEAWKGPDGLIYGDFIGERNQYKAFESCKNLGGELPSQADFERGEANGFREVLPNMKDRWFWSSSVYSNNHASGCSFNGYDGAITYVPGYYTGSARCVWR